MKPSCGLGEAHQYIEQMYEVIPLIAERLTGTSSCHYVQTEILDPIGMDATNWKTDDKTTLGRWTDHKSTTHDEDVHSIRPGLSEMSGGCGANQMQSSLQDLVSDQSH